MNRRNIFTLILTIAGVAALVWQVRLVGEGSFSAGVHAIADRFQQVGLLGFAGVLVLSFSRYMLRSAAWITLVNARVPFGAALSASIAGDALGQITPFSVIVSEPAKAMYLRSDVPAARALAALAAENLFYTVSLGVFILAGVISMLATFQLRTIVRVVAFASLFLMLALIAVLLWIAWRSPAVASGAVARLPFFNLDRFVVRLRDFEQTMYGFLRQGSHRLRTIIACEIGFHIVSFSESLLVLRLLTGRLLPLEAFILDATNRIVNVVVRVPFKVRFDEAGQNVVATAIGLGGPLGVTMAIVRKCRLIVWAVIGLFLLARRGVRKHA